MSPQRRKGSGEPEIEKPEIETPAGLALSVDELLALGQLAGYSRAEAAQMILDAR